MASIALEGVTKAFRDGTVAVRDLDLRVDDGEFFVLLGPSGSGKTTILRMVAGLEGTTEGRILLDDEDVTDAPTPKRDVAMVFQHLALYPHLNVYDNIAFGVRARRLKKAVIDERVRRAVAVLGLEDSVKKRPRSLSMGQAQRVALGRAMIREPRAFLMDEPLASLDERLRIQMRGELARIQRDVGITTLYVTHDQSEATTLGDRVGILRRGVLVDVQTPKAMYERPGSLFVAGFVGSPPMNLAEATVDRTEDGAFVVLFGGHRVELDAETMAARPRVADYLRRQVVIGIRPEHLRGGDAAATSTAGRLRGRAGRTETIGVDTYVQFDMDAPLLLAEDAREASGDGPADDAWPSERGNVWMARMERAPVTEGDVVDLALEPGALHVFDPRTGEPVLT
jgi:multiple sugar transport system ATP-binding protein